MNSGASKRITKELNEIKADPPVGMTVGLKDDSDLHVWEILMDGPDQSVYAGGHFKLVMTLPKDYPFRPPVLNFHTKIYHPNVSNDGKGSMCLGMLKPEEWKPPNKIIAVLNLTRNLLVEPIVEDAVETSIAEQFKNDPKGFERTARDWVKKYAGGK